MQGSNPPDSKPAGVQGSLLVFDQAKSEAAEVFNKLTDMQRKYAEARLAGMIPLHAAQAAGISVPEVNAYRYEKHPKIQKALIAARKMVVEKFDVNREDVIRGMFDAVQASATATELVAAWREIGRIIGAYEPAKVEIMHRIEDVTLDKLQRLSTKELIELAEGRDFVVESEDDKFGDEYRQMYVAMTYAREDTDDDGEEVAQVDRPQQGADEPESEEPLGVGTGPRGAGRADPEDV